MRKKLLKILLAILFSSMVSFADVKTIEQEYRSCLKGLTNNIEMASCTNKASILLNKEIEDIFHRQPNIKYNQNLWNLYKNSTEATINTPLREASGTIYYLFAENNLYQIYKNRLFILENIDKKIAYNQEYFLSNNLQSCLSKSKTDLEKEKCYINEIQIYSDKINKELKNLKLKLSENQYNNIKNNQSAWEIYKDNIKLIFNNQISDLIRYQIIKMLYQERYEQLSNLLDFYKNE